MRYVVPTWLHLRQQPRAQHRSASLEQRSIISWYVLLWAHIRILRLWPWLVKRHIARQFRAPVDSPKTNVVETYAGEVSILNASQPNVCYYWELLWSSSLSRLLRFTWQFMLECMIKSYRSISEVLTFYVTQIVPLHTRWSVTNTTIYGASSLSSCLSFSVQFWICSSLLKILWRTIFAKTHHTKKHVRINLFLVFAKKKKLIRMYCYTVIYCYIGHTLVDDWEQ